MIITKPTTFLGEKLCADEIGMFEGRVVHKLTKILVWINGTKIAVLPNNMESDLASVPRVPVIYFLWGDRAHREAFLHDFFYRCDSYIYLFKTTEQAVTFALACYDAGMTVEELAQKLEAVKQPVSRDDADWYFREAMIGQGCPWGIYHPMYLGVRAGGGASYHRMSVKDSFKLEGGI